MHRMLNFQVWKHPTRFFKECTFKQLHYFSFVYDCLSLWVDICMLNILLGFNIFIIQNLEIKG